VAKEKELVPGLSSGGEGNWLLNIVVGMLIVGEIESDSRGADKDKA
jgi:hypothetical protein